MCQNSILKFPKKQYFSLLYCPFQRKVFLAFLELCIFIHFHSTHKTEVQSPITGLCLRRECRILDNLLLLKAYSVYILKILLGFLSFYFWLTIFNSICSLDLFLLIVFPVQLWIWLAVLMAYGRKWIFSWCIGALK